MFSGLQFLPEAFPAPLAAPFGYCPYRPGAWQGRRRLSHTGQPPNAGSTVEITHQVIEEIAQLKESSKGRR